jgi:hypothetical protein
MFKRKERERGNIWKSHVIMGIGEKKERKKFKSEKKKEGFVELRG